MISCKFQSGENFLSYQLDPEAIGYSESVCLNGALRTLTIDGNQLEKIRRNESLLSACTELARLRFEVGLIDLDECQIACQKLFKSIGRPLVVRFSLSVGEGLREFRVEDSDSSVGDSSLEAASRKVDRLVRENFLLLYWKSVVRSLTTDAFVVGKQPEDSAVEFCFPQTKASCRIFGFFHFVQSIDNAQWCSKDRYETHRLRHWVEELATQKRAPCEICYDPIGGDERSFSCPGCRCSCHALCFSKWLKRDARTKIRYSSLVGFCFNCGSQCSMQL